MNRRFAVVSLLIFSALLPVLSARADQRAITVLATASFVDPTAPPALVATQGDLPVAHSPFGEQARAVFSLDLSTITQSARIRLRTSGQPGASYGTSSIRACRVTGPWAPGAGQALTEAPATDCTGAVAVIGTGSWEFDLGPLLSAWRSGAPALGIALVDGAGAVPARTTFNVLTGERVGATGPTPGGSSPVPTPGALPEPATVPPRLFPPSSAVLPELPLAVPKIVVAAPVPAPEIAPAPLSALPGTVALVAFRPLPVRPEVWLLLPFGLGLLVLLCRAVSSGTDLDAAS